MSTKTENIKNFINQTGKDNQLFLFVGSDNIDSTSDSNSSQIETWKYSDFSLKIGKDNIIPVVPNVKWVKKRIYTPWKSNKTNAGNYYAYNDFNGYVYLCISDNKEHRDDYLGKNVSNNIPSHTAGDVSYEDGYTWKALYKITPNLERFVTEQWIPVVSFDLFEDIDKSNAYTQMQSFCSPAGTKTSGKCALYFKQNIKYLSHLGTYINGIKGNLYEYFTMECHDCYNTFKDHPNFVVNFTTQTTPNSTVTIKDTYDLIGELIDQNKIPVSSPYYYLHKANKDSPEEGYIVSATINLGSRDIEELSISTDNPELTIQSNTGSGAAIRLKTFRSAINNKIYVNGIEIISRGSGYKDIKLSLTSASMLGSLSANSLVSLITVNLDEIDGLGFDPMLVLNAKHSMIDVRVDKPTIETANISIPSTINFYTLIQNPKYDNEIDVVAGTTENKYLNTLYRTTTKLSVSTPTNIGGDPILPQVEEVGVITKTDGSIISDIIVSKIIPPTTPGGDSKFEIKGIEYNEAELIVGSNFVVDGVNYTVNTVDASPSLIQYSGKILSTNKTTAINVIDEDTALIRINMVKGM